MWSREWQKSACGLASERFSRLLRIDRPRPARQGHQREVNSVVVVTQIEDPREAGAGEFGFIPSAVGILMRQQIMNGSRAAG